LIALENNEHQTDMSTMNQPKIMRKTSIPRLPALPANWVLKGDYLTDDEGCQRYIKDKGGKIDRMRIAQILEGYSFQEHAAAWKHGTEAYHNNALISAIKACLPNLNQHASAMPEGAAKNEAFARIHALYESLPSVES